MKQAKHWHDMTKIQIKSEKLTPFGGTFGVLVGLILFYIDSFKFIWVFHHWSKRKWTIDNPSKLEYIYYLKDSFLIEEALRYDVKGRKYIGTETKYYFADIGIRAAILNYRQQEEMHIMENIIYNELRCRGYNVDVGLVELGGKDENGKFVRKQLEVDFVVNRPPYRVYIQSAFHMPTPEKEQQERRPLLSINDHFRKIVIVGDDIHRKEDELGVLTVGLLDFLTDKNLLEQG